MCVKKVAPWQSACQLLSCCLVGARVHSSAALLNDAHLSWHLLRPQPAEALADPFCSTCRPLLSSNMHVQFFIIKAEHHNHPQFVFTPQRQPV